LTHLPSSIVYMPNKDSVFISLLKKTYKYKR